MSKLQHPTHKEICIYIYIKNKVPDGSAHPEWYLNISMDVTMGMKINQSFENLTQ